MANKESLQEQGPEPLISIIMPCLNGEAHLPDAIRSVLEQHWKNWELLIIDNGSTDGSVQIAESFNELRITMLHEAEKGVSRARNRGLIASNGEYICFLDADDVMPPHSLDSRATILAQQPDVCFVDGAVNLMDKELTTVIREYRPSFFGDVTQELLKLTGSCFVSCTWMIRRIPGMTIQFDTSMTHAEDLDLFLFLAPLGKFATTDQLIMLYRQHDASAMKDLRGLHRGYEQLTKNLIDRGMLSEEKQKQVFWKRVRSIMAKSYAKQGHPLLALRTMLSARPDLRDRSN